MGASVSSALNREPGTGLTKADAERLKRRFHKLGGGADVLSVRQFELIPELAGNPFLPRLFAMFDTDKDGRLTQAEFNSAIDYFLRAQSAEERMQFTFRMYDLEGTGYVTEADLLDVLEKGAGSQFSTKQLHKIVRSTVDEYDKDGDGKLSFSEFQSLVVQADLDATVLP